MIVDNFILFFIDLWNAFVGLLPPSTGFPVEVDNAITFIARIVHMFDGIIPTSTIFDTLIFVYGVKIAILFATFLIIISKVLRGNFSFTHK